MSFYSGNRQGCNPGPIVGNPLNGLCEKACIQTRKVFDACMKQLQVENAKLDLADWSPSPPQQPLNFTGCSSKGSDAVIENLVVDRFDDRPNFARVSGDVYIPITIEYVDVNGVSGKANSKLKVPIDVVLFVPQPSIVPYQISAFASAICSSGNILGTETCTADLCVTIIIRVIVDAELLVPTYGYCQIPPCQDYTQDVCSGFFDLPLYPSQQSFVCDGGGSCGCQNSQNNN